jgi:hypothetical protein
METERMIFFTSGIEEALMLNSSRPRPRRMTVARDLPPFLRTSPRDSDRVRVLDAGSDEAQDRGMEGLIEVGGLLIAPVHRDGVY